MTLAADGVDPVGGILVIQSHVLCGQSSERLGMSHYYMLDGKTPVPCDDINKWGAWFNYPGVQRVDCTEVGQVKVSTVFLGIDHSFGNGPPLLFETMIFGLQTDQDQGRCSTWDEAVEMHRAAVEHVRLESLPLWIRPVIKLIIKIIRRWK
jgi:hypothetical protein